MSVYCEKPALLDRERHKRLGVRTSSDFAFARQANSVYLAGVEFNEAMKEYAIVFTRAATNQREFARTEVFCRRLEQAGLLRCPMPSRCRCSGPANCTWCPCTSRRCRT